MVMVKKREMRASSVVNSSPKRNAESGVCRKYHKKNWCAPPKAVNNIPVEQSKVEKISAMLRSFIDIIVRLISLMDSTEQMKMSRMDPEKRFHPQ